MSVEDRSRRVAAFVCACALATSSFASPVLADSAKRACVAASTEAQTLRNDDKLLEARARLRICASDPCPALLKTRCATWLAEVEARIPTIIVRAQDGAGADVLDVEVTIDGHAGQIGRPETVDPGEHVVTVQRTNGAYKEEKFLVVDGEKSRVLSVRVGPAKAPGAPAGPAAPDGPSTAPAPRDASGPGVPLGAWVVGGLGVLSLGAAAYFTVAASNDLNHLRQTCSPVCDDAQTQDGRTHALLADVSLGVGVAAVGVAVVWALVSHGGEASHATAWAPVIDVRPVPGGAVTVVGARY